MLFFEIVLGMIPVFISNTVFSSVKISEKLSILLCKEACKCHGGCVYVGYRKKNLQCMLLFQNDKAWTKEGIRVIQVPRKDYQLTCCQNERMIYTKGGYPKCVRGKKATRKRGGKCVKKNLEAPGNETVTDKQSVCIHREENITVETGKFAIRVELPRLMTAGMTMTASGAYHRKYDSSSFSIPMDYKNPTNPITSLTINIYWKEKKMNTLKGFTTTMFEGDFPISDPSNFTLTVVQKPGSSMVYIDRVLVTTQKMFRIRDLAFMWFSKIHRLVVQKSEEGSNKVDSRIP